VASGLSAIAVESTGTARMLRVQSFRIHVRVNFHESYREYLATTFRRESKSCLAGSLRSLLRAPELRDLSVPSFHIYARVNACCLTTTVFADVQGPCSLLSKGEYLPSEYYLYIACLFVDTI